MEHNNEKKKKLFSFPKAVKFSKRAILQFEAASRTISIFDAWAPVGKYVRGLIFKNLWKFTKRIQKSTNMKTFVKRETTWYVYVNKALFWAERCLAMV